MSGVFIKYGGIAVDSDKFEVQANNKADFVKEQSILDRSLTYKNIGNPCEPYSVVLDGSVSAFPDDADSENLGYWSESVSDEEGYFQNPITLEFESDEYFSSAGITLTFDDKKEIFPTDVKIEWYDGSSLLAFEDFKVDSVRFFCSKKVDLYNRVVMTFYRMNLPKNRLKIQCVEFGIMADSDTNFSLKNAQISREISPISEKIPINTIDFSFSSRNNIEYSFQERQPVEVFFNGALQGKFFVKKAKRTSVTDYEVLCEDFFGLLDSVNFYGGIYTNKDAVQLLKEIFSTAKIPFIISSELNTEKVTGYLPYGSCRQALMQVLFSIQAIAETSGLNCVRIRKLKNNLEQKITKSRIMQGIKIENSSRVSAVELTAHSFVKIQEEQTVYDSLESGIGKNRFVLFNEPLHSLSIINGDIVKSDANYAIINANSGCILTGKKFQHIKTVKSLKNSSLLSTDSDNIIRITDATLISIDNVDNVLRECYNYLIKPKNINVKIVDGKHKSEEKKSIYGIAVYGLNRYGNGDFKYDKTVKLGDKIELETDYSGDITGIVVQQAFTLNGGISVKQTILR